MCFCASASFSAAAGLGAVGLLSIRAARRPSQHMFAAIPLLFAMQQAAEGVVWVTAGNPELIVWQSVATYIFLFFAFVLWPIWVPLSLLLFGRTDQYALSHIRIRQLNALSVFGGLVSGAFAVLVLIFGAQATTHTLHVQYLFAWPELMNQFYVLGLIIYCVPTMLPFFIVCDKRLRALGMVLLLSCIFAYLVWYNFFVSIWCFFAAVLSVLILYVVTSNNKTIHEEVL